MVGILLFLYVIPDPDFTDLLDHIFQDNSEVFHHPLPTEKLCTFRDMYIYTFSTSPKCSKAIKEKMADTPAFALELAKIALLTNVGRINTTMAFFPEVATPMRTYHPIPSLQKTDGNAQDAPRIKTCLKAALLPSESLRVHPAKPDEILEQSRAGRHPATSVVNLIFVLSIYAIPLSSVHFDGVVHFFDLFLPRPLVSPDRLSSPDRARAFLWLMYYYLENPDGHNPFGDAFSQLHPGKAPLIERLKDEERMGDMDPPEELEWGAMMAGQRQTFIKRIASGEDPRIIKSRAGIPRSAPSAPAPIGPLGPRSFVAEYPKGKEPVKFIHETPNRGPPIVSNAIRAAPPQSARSSPPQERSMLEHTWRRVMACDPLIDSEDESQDEHFKVEHTRRLRVISRLRGRPPTLDDESAPLGRFQPVQSWE
ncbi:hypothetical protein DFH07DRAFT_961996 [Mycena maculata]|uniref:Ino eighty subunit 1 n=1 Tax=Mycena maculata TaxID=230809 RepID=A0AAD7N756_9AGAR|nr:hypothetical protein DFH07DRAFT_961996 [Mycena maculata]